MPPLVVMTGVLVGATAYGILGALLATPVIASAREILRYIYSKLMGKEPFPEGLGAKEPDQSLTVGVLQKLRGWAQRLVRTRLPAETDPAVDKTVEQTGSNTDAE